MSTSPSKWSDACECSTAPWWFSMPKKAWNPQSEQVWRQADRYGVPRICFVNKMDKRGADFGATVASITARLGVKPLVIQLPIGAEDTFEGIVDLVEMTAKVWEDADDFGMRYRTVAIPDGSAELARRYRSELMEAVAESDEGLLEKFSSGVEFTVEEIKGAIRRMTVASEVYPVLCGSALGNKGVQPLLDAVVDYLPSPSDSGGVAGHLPGTDIVVYRDADTDGPFAALAFKVAAHPFFGRLVYLRVYSGQVAAGATVLNSTTGRKERLGKLFRMHADTEYPVERVRAGDICAVIGLKDTTTGNTLCDPRQPIALESMTFPEPVITVSVEPATGSDRERLSAAIQVLAEEDPTVSVRLDPETGQTVLGGMGELHLDVLANRLRGEFGVAAAIGKPRVTYRETITETYRLEYTHRKQTGGSGQYAKVVLGVEPMVADDGAVYEFESRVVGGRVPKEYVPAVDAGAQDAVAGGVLGGYPMVNVRVVLFDGAAHTKDPSELAFRTAAADAVRKALAQAGPVLLEPIMRIEATTPEEYLGEVMGDLNSRRGRIQATALRGAARVVTALVPLEEMFGYIGDLRSKTKGRASYTMVFDSYAQVPPTAAARILAR